MASTHVDLARAEWVSGVTFYGPGAVYECRDIAIDRANRHLELVGERGGGEWAGRRAQRLDDVEEAIGAAHHWGTSGLIRRCWPLTPTLSPPAGRGRDPREAWEGEGHATPLPLTPPPSPSRTWFCHQH